MGIFRLIINLKEGFIHYIKKCYGKSEEDK